MNSNKEIIPLWQFSYTSEWALAKFFPIILNNNSGLFQLVGVSGRAENSDKAAHRILECINKRTNNLLEGKNWRKTNTLTEMESCQALLRRFTEKNLDYYSVNGNVNSENLPNPGSYSAAVIHIANTLHFRYIEALMAAGKHILCEKPLVTLTNGNHQADDTELRGLEKLLEKYRDSGIITMDAEHYSAKKATKAFFENIGDMVGKYGRISKVEGHTYEKDDPEKDRTRDVLCRKNRTGLLLDMGVHLFGIITNIEGNMGKIFHAEYDIYPGHKIDSSRECIPYDVETYVKTCMEINGELFHKDAKGEFIFAKFVNRFNEPIEKDDKKVIITFLKKEESTEKNIETKVTINLSEGNVEDDKGYTYHTLASKEEYTNILADFYNAIIRKQQPRTSFKNSIKNLDAIYRCYRDFPIEKNIKEMYKK